MEGSSRVDPDLIETVAPAFRAMRRYSRLTVEGAEHLPAGKCVIAANHTGWLGLDYAFLFLVLYDDCGRFPRVAVHPTFYRVEKLDLLKERLGMFEVSVTAATKALDEGDVVVVFPEAEDGNFKPLWERRQLAPFKPGFARIALAADAPVVPVVIVGGDETSPNLAKLPTREKIGLNLPLPLPLPPLPAKWRIRFLPAIDVGSYLEGDAQDADAADALTRRVEAQLQDALGAEMDRRGHPFL